MALIQWEDRYSVKIAEMDKHHQRLCDILNDFYAELKAGSPHESLLKMVQELEDYTIYHFEAEEKLLADNKYPKLDRQKVEHDAFINKVKDYRERYETGRLLISLEVTNFVRDWLVNHILKTDMEYAQYLNSRGVH